MPKGGKRTGAGRKPGARNKASKEVKDIIDDVVEPKTLVVGLTGIAQNIEAPHAARVAAYKELLDRRFGKAPQAITGANGGPLAMIAMLGTANEDQLEEIIAHLGGDGSGE